MSWPEKLVEKNRLKGIRVPPCLESVWVATSSGMPGKDRFQGSVGAKDLGYSGLPKAKVFAESPSIAHSISWQLALSLSLCVYLFAHAPWSLRETSSVDHCGCCSARPCQAQHSQS